MTKFHVDSTEFAVVEKETLLLLTTKSWQLARTPLYVGDKELCSFCGEPKRFGIVNHDYTCPAPEIERLVRTINEQITNN